MAAKPIKSINEEDKVLSGAPTRRETFAEAIGSMFTPKRDGVLPVLTVALGLASLGWLADSILPLLHDLAASLFHLPVETKFLESLEKASIPAAVILLLIGFVYFFGRKRVKPVDYEQVVPAPHKGLIVQLSLYSTVRDMPAYANPQAIVQAIKEQSLDKDKIFSGCNWGQMGFVVNYHAPALSYCWIVVTRNTAAESNPANGSEAYYEDAKKMIQSIVKPYREVTCRQVVVDDPNNIGETAQKIAGIYRQIKKLEFPLDEDEVIADFTGGTAAMSGGMILSTLDAGQKIECVKQDKKLPLSSRITTEEIHRQKLIISPTTSVLVKSFK